MEPIRFAVGDCLDVFGAEPDESFDAFITDPPAGVAFMSREWDKDRGGRDKWIAFWADRFRVACRKAKPGAYALVWALPRTSHWTACAIEDGGWEVVDVIVHLQSQGWPKGGDLAKQAKQRGIACSCQSNEVSYPHEESQSDAARVQGVRAGVDPEERDAGAPEQGLFAGVRGAADIDGEDGQAPNEGAGVPGVRGGVQAEEQPCSGQGSVLLSGVQRAAQGKGTRRAAKARQDCGAGSQGVDSAERGNVPGQDDRGAQPGLEGRRHAGELGPVSDPSMGGGAAAPSLHGAPGRLDHGASPRDGALDGAPADANRGGAPRQSRSAGQPAGEPGVVAEQLDAQARGAWPICRGCGKPRIPAGLSTALKPSAEHWILARKPIERGLTIAQNVAKWGTGALQIDASRVARGERPEMVHNDRAARSNGCSGATTGSGPTGGTTTLGSWPANAAFSHCPECEERGTRRVKASHDGVSVASSSMGYGGGRGGVPHASHTAPDGTETVPAFDCLAGCDCGASVLAPAGGAAPRCACGSAMWWACPVAALDEMSGDRRSAYPGNPAAAAAYAGAQVEEGLLYGAGAGSVAGLSFADSGGASRFFNRFTYQAKASGGERHAGCEHLLWKRNPRNPFGFDRVDRAVYEVLAEADRAFGNVHPTVKRLSLMEHLVGLVTSPGGRIGDITAGSGGTGIAVALLNAKRSLGASFLGADICPEAIEIARARLAWWLSNPTGKPKKPKGPPAIVDSDVSGPLFARQP